jgi:hypothetical protein
MSIVDYSLFLFIALVVIVGIGGFILANRDDD